MSAQTKTLSQMKDSRLLYDKNPPPFAMLLILIVLISLIGITIWSMTAKKNYVITSSGVVVSEMHNYIMSTYTGEITDTLVSEGDYVQQGDPLFYISSTDLDLQEEQIQGMIEVDNKKIAQYQRLENSVKSGVNLFNENDYEDKPYYYQYETYLSQVSQKEVDVSAYKNYGYSDAQIETTIQNNEAAISEIYYSTLKTISDSVQTLQTEVSNYEVQLESIKSGQAEYSVTASTSGVVHMDTEYKTGMVVQAGSAIGTIVNENDSHTVTVYTAANDMPLIHVGDSVDVAVSGLAQSVYGTIDGTVIYIANEATTDSKNNSSSFMMKIVLDSGYLISNQGNKVNLSNGMAVEARILYDEVTYFQYVMEALGVLTR